MRDPDPNFTPQEAEEARAYLREYGGDVQQKFNEQADAGGEQLFIIIDTFGETEAANRTREGNPTKAGEEALYVTSNDELIVDYWRHLLSEPTDVGKDMPDMRLRETFLARVTKEES